MEIIVISVIVAVLIILAVALNSKNIEATIDFVEDEISHRLKELRLRPTQLRLWIQLWMVITVFGFVLVWVASGTFPLALMVILLFGAGPWYILRRLARERRFRIEDQLADSMVMFSSGIRAGLSLAQALDLLANDCPKPIRQEFAQMVGEYQLGKPLERVLEESKERLNSENFVLFAAALLASRESGGRLNETVERISRSILEMQRLERKIQSETAQAKKSTLYMAAVPPFVLIIYAWLDPNNVGLLFSTLPGQIMLAVALMLNIVAYFWAVKILNPDI